MPNLKGLVEGYRALLHVLAEVTVSSLELVGILIIAGGSIRTLAHLWRHLRQKRTSNLMVELGRVLSLALEFKMGAEIVNTVIVREIRELLILGLVIALRAVLAILIHWELRNERRDGDHLSAGASPPF